MIDKLYLSDLTVVISKADIFISLQRNSSRQLLKSHERQSWTVPLDHFVK